MIETRAGRFELIRRSRRAALATASIVVAGALVQVLPARAQDLASPPSELELVGDAIRSPVVVREIRLPVPLRIGRGELTAEPGTRSYLLAARGRTCGVWVAGPARFTYRVEDPFSLPVAEWNLKQLTRLSIERRPAGAVVLTSLREAVVWGWDVVAAEPPAPDETAPPAFSPWAADQLESSGFDNPAHDMLLASGNGHRGYVNARLRAEKESFVLDVDPRPHVATEWLARLADRAKNGDRPKSPATLVLQPIDRDWWELGPAPFTVVEVSSGIVNDRGPHLVSRARMRVVAGVQGLSLLSFRTEQPFRTPDGSDAPVLLRRISVDGQPVRHRFRDGFLLVELPRALGPGEEVTVESEIEGDLLRRRAHDTYWWLTGAAVALRPGDNNKLRATFDLTLETPGPFVPFASGTTIEWVQGPTSRLRSRVGLPTPELPTVAAGAYRSFVESVEGYRVVVSTYSGVSDPDAQRVGRAFFEAKECLEEMLGASYPFVETDILEVEPVRIGWGMPALFQFPRQVFQPTPAPGLSTLRETVTQVLAQGFASQVLPIRDDRDIWLPSSIASYLAALCLQRAEPEPAAGARKFASQLERWRDDVRKVEGPASIYLARHRTLEDADDWRDYATLRFSKGALVLHAVRRELWKLRGSEVAGDESFRGVIRELASVGSSSFVSTADVIAILNRTTDRDWRTYFQDHILGVATPAGE